MTDKRAHMRPYTVFLLAGNYAQAEEYARVYLHSQQPFTYIDSEWHLRGLTNIHYLRCGTWQRRPDLRELEIAMANRGAIDITEDMPSEHVE